MTQIDALAIAARVLNYTRNKQRPVALFVHGCGCEIAHVQGDTYERLMRRFPQCLVGTYDRSATAWMIAGDVLDMPTTRAVA
jgi:hypothetical protein